MLKPNHWFMKLLAKPKRLGVYLPLLLMFAMSIKTFSGALSDGGWQFWAALVGMSLFGLMLLAIVIGEWWIHKKTNGSNP